MVDAKPDIAIVGAGLGGLTAALALARRGFPVTVFEQAEFLGEVGAGIQMSANAVRVLFALGLEEALSKVASHPSGKQVRLWNTGQTWKLFDLGQESVERYGFPYFTLHRADLHAALSAELEKAAPGSIKLGRRCIDFQSNGERVKIQFDDGSEEESDLLIGADGVHSVIRNGLFGASDPEFTGCLAWRGVVQTRDLPERFHAPIGNNWIGPSGHIIHYPLRRGELTNFVGIVERDDWQIESWTQDGSVQECLHDFAGWHEDVTTLISRLSRPMKWALMLRKPLGEWSRGPVSLLGDACHPTLPFLAQGAAMAIEDGYVLARALDLYTDDPTYALKRYEQARCDRTRRIVEGSAANTTRFHNPALRDPETAAAYVDAEWANDKINERYDWLFTYDATSCEI